MKRKIKSRNMKAAFTLEAAVVVPIAMVIIVSMLFIAFFIHDCVVMNTVSSYMIMEKTADYSERPEAVKDEILKMLSGRMIISKNIAINVKGNEDKMSVTGNSEVSIPVPLIQELTDITGSTVSVNISNLYGRKKLLKYKSICDGFRNVLKNPSSKEIDGT